VRRCEEVQQREDLDLDGDELGNVVGFGYYLPKVGLAVSAISGVLLWIWYIAIRRSFLKLGRSTGKRLGRGLEPHQWAGSRAIWTCFRLIARSCRSR
jgi:hypothetical protein